MIKSIIAEFFGTFMLVFVGCGTAALFAKKDAAAIATALAFGAVLIILVAGLNKVSGANLNPAVSLGLAMNGQITYGAMFYYWIAQILGAIVAALLLLYLLGKESGLGASIGEFTKTAPWKAVIVEALLTFFLVYVILTIVNNKSFMADDTSFLASIVIGITLFIGVLVGYYMTGGSLNPARSIGPALFTDNINTLWIYILGPLVGGGLAALVYKYFSGSRNSEII